LPTYLATHLFTVAGAIVFDYVQRLLINALFYGKFTSNECRSISLPENGEKACQYGTGWLKVYALNNDNMHEHDLFIYLYQNLKTAPILSSVSNVLTILLAYKYLYLSLMTITIIINLHFNTYYLFYTTELLQVLVLCRHHTLYCFRV
jgi:hypothetical protein